MRAVVHERYGPPSVLRVVDVARPEPADDEVLVKVRATAVNRTDCGFRQGKPAIVRLFSGLRQPRRHVLGTEFAGVVESLGAGVTTFAVGDEVFGVNADRFGAHAEYVAVRERAPIAHKPAGPSFEEAAAVCDGGILALTCLRWTGVRPGRRVLVYGASGSIGTAAVQLAKHLGASVTAVCDTRRLELVRSLGADRVIDYTAEDFTRHGDQYDVVLDAVGKVSFRRCRPLLGPHGVYASTDGGYLWQNVPLAALTWATSRLGAHQVMMPLPRYRQKDVELLAALLEKGEYRAVVDRTYPLDQVVEATEYVETEQKTGNVVLTLD